MSDAKPNRLIKETSPYLLQHAHNPVDWYPWGPEALECAKAEDKPILLSVGYSACHWCHVMERESFEDARTAALMNQNFVNVKVDREERPDIDSIYMTAIQVLSGRGGWPMTVFLTPDGKPFYGGTYFPPEDRSGMPGFPRVLQAMAQAYRENRGEVVRATDQLLQRIRQITAPTQGLDPLSADLMQRAFRGIADQFDEKYGGIGPAPKFPQPMTYEFLLRYYVRTGDSDALDVVELTLDRMANGGIYDHVGGGFHRYSTDAFWLVPHFEKMLYDNALLAKLYLHAYQVTGKELYRRVVEETLEYVRREMTDPSGGFYSAQDADSEGVEGNFFVWSLDEICNVLGRDEAEIVNRYYGVTPEGNFEGRNILHVAYDPGDAAAGLGTDHQDIDAMLSRSKIKLLEARNRRVHPGLDDKAITSWNALMMRAFAEAASVLGRADYRDIANRNAKFLLGTLFRDGRLLRTYKDGKANLNGYLEDYAYLIDALVVLHEATFDASWLQEATNLGHSMIDLFWDEAAGVFYDTGKDHETLIVRPRDVSDNAVPSGSAVAADILMRLAVITGDHSYERIATTAMRSVRELMLRFPSGAGHWLCALDFYLSPVKEVVIIGSPADQAAQALISEVYRHYLPNRVLLGAASDDSTLAELPLMEGRGMVDGHPTAYVCENYVCQLPVTEPRALAKQLVG